MLKVIKMKSAIISLALLCAFGLYAEGGLKEAKRLMEENKPAEAVRILIEEIRYKPYDPWLNYNFGVALYAQKNFDEAEKVWQELASAPLPKDLQDKVWTQIGNVSFRKGESYEESSPENALPFYEQSREAYRIAIATKPKDKVAVHNLKVVELRLAKLHSRLAKRLLSDTKNKSLKETIEKLQAALDHQRTAKDLDPKNEEYATDVADTEKRLSQKFTEKARQEEQRADSVVNNPSPQNWEREQAIKQLETALSDYREAGALDQQNTEAMQGEQRVIEKLSNLLTRTAQQLHAEADREKSWNPEDAISKYERAIEKYDEALQMKENNEVAKTGREEAEKFLEQLYMQQGDKLAEQGRKKIQNNPAEAAENMMNALHNYEQALEINPNNTEAPPKISALEKELPPLLMALGEREQQRAAQAEPKSPEKAVAHLEKAASSYEMVQQIDENNEQAKQRAAQVQKDMLRLREQLAKQAQQQLQQQQKQPHYVQSFQTMLGWVKNDDKQKQYEEARRSPTTKYDPQDNRIFKNW